MTDRKVNRIVRIHIRNVLGIEELEVEPGHVNVIEGGNGEGKTSFLAALLTLEGGGFDATLVRDGAETAEVVFVLDDETEIATTIRRDGSGARKVKHPDFGTIGRAQTFLRGIANPLTLNPVSMLTAKGPERTRVLLEALPMEVPVEELRAALAAFLPGLDGIELEGHALEVIDEVRKRVFDERTAINRVAKDKQTTADQLRESLPETVEDPATIRTSIAANRETERGLRAELQARREVHEAAARTELEETNRRASASVGEMEAGIEARRQAIREEITDLRGALAELDVESERSAGEFRTTHEGRRREILAFESTAKDEDRAEYTPKIKEIELERVVLTERLEHAGGHAKALAIFEDVSSEASSNRTQSGKLTAALAQVDAIKLALSAQIPIAGVSVEDGELKVDGHPFHRANRARQIQVVVEAARLRAGKLPILCVDGLECLEPEVFADFVAALKASDPPVQGFLTRVTEGPLDVHALEGSA